MMDYNYTYYEHNHNEIKELLLGHRVVSVEKFNHNLRPSFDDNDQSADGKAILDNGTVLILEGNDGGCACTAGCYDLTELNTVDNVITNVEFEDSPDDPDAPWDAPAVEGSYRIFVFADNQRLNFATFTGSDGNGYYGTGYSIKVRLS